MLPLHGPLASAHGVLGNTTLVGLAGGAAVWVAARGTARVLRAGQKGLFVRKRKRPHCPRCAGFGIERCLMCSGSGVVISAHPRQIIPCPRCVKSRHIPCTMCTGSGRRGGPLRRLPPVPAIAATLPVLAASLPALGNAVRGALAFMVARSSARER